ncbi:MAG: nitroreductase family protein [Pseudomonadota bacterium]
MDAIENLIGRRSTPAKRLTEPAPDDRELDTLFRAAVTAPDHGQLQPWSFIVIRGEARQRLGDLFAEAYQMRDPEVDSEALENYRNKPLRAPLIIAVVARITPGNPKVPEQEQVLSAGCAAEHIQLAARAMGYGSIWLTGINTRDWKVCEGLGLGFDDKLVGYLYLGTPPESAAAPERPEPSTFVREWSEPCAGEETAI